MLSVFLLGVTAACWAVGAVRGRQETVWRVWPQPQRTFFVRLEPQHLIVSQQTMAPVGMPPGYAVDSTEFRAFTVRGPDFSGGVGVTMAPDYFALQPPPGWFRKVDVQGSGVVVRDKSGAVAWRAVGGYRAVEVPWWSLLLLFSILPAGRWAARRRRRAKSRRGLCPECGYDLRATPQRCPECGAAAGGAGAGAG